MKNGNGHPVLRVLLIDDSIDDEKLIRRELGRNYKVILKRVQTEAAMALELDLRIWDVVVCDYLMPNFSPFRALELLKGSALDIPFICLSGAIDEERALELMEAGANDFITKGNLSRLTLAVKRQMVHADQRLQNKLDLEESYIATLEAFGTALEMRDHFTKGHTVRVTDTTLSLARAMGIAGTTLVDIHRGALLHDVGKLGIPDIILLKNGPLDPAERKIMETHPVLAYNMLKPISFLKNSIYVPYCHHEKWDGTGYQMQLKGEEIPLAARIFSIVDCYDAMISERPYRKGLSLDVVLTHIHEQRGKAFDPQVVDAFWEMAKRDGYGN